MTVGDDSSETGPEMGLLGPIRLLYGLILLGNALNHGQSGGLEFLFGQLTRIPQGPQVFKGVAEVRVLDRCIHSSADPGRAGTADHDDQCKQADPGKDVGQQPFG